MNHDASLNSDEQLEQLPSFGRHVRTLAELLPLVDEWVARPLPLAPVPGVRSAGAGPTGSGLFASAAFCAGDTVLTFDCEATCCEAPIRALLEAHPYGSGSRRRKYAQDVIQLDDDVYALPGRTEAWLANHSCVPSTYLRVSASAGLELVALGCIEPGDEVTFDYSTVALDEYSLACLERRPGCRGCAMNPALFSDEQKRALLARIPLAKLTAPVRRLLASDYAGGFDVGRLATKHEGPDLAGLVQARSASFSEAFARQLVREYPKSASPMS
eukprot:m51a1_g8411 hypothetical protein (272) ;mRNA; r:276819-277634